MLCRNCKYFNTCKSFYWCSFHVEDFFENLVDLCNNEIITYDEIENNLPYDLYKIFLRNILEDKLNIKHY